MPSNGCWMIYEGGYATQHTNYIVEPVNLVFSGPKDHHWGDFLKQKKDSVGAIGVKECLDMIFIHKFFVLKKKILKFWKDNYVDTISLVNPVSRIVTISDNYSYSLSRKSPQLFLAVRDQAQTNIG